MNQERLMKILLSPHVSEKSARVADKHNQIVFKVAVDATKPEVKQAVEKMFDVKVKAVQMLNVMGKTKRFSNMMGKRKSWKKAYVTLAEGSDIDFLGAESA
jgi:large subunit ribosomal protein L23